MGKAKTGAASREALRASKNNGSEADSVEIKTFTPRTPLGKLLWNIRKKIISSGEPLLDLDEIDREVAERRGEAG
jgi:hypothetical protein